MDLKNLFFAFVVACKKTSQIHGRYVHYAPDEIHEKWKHLVKTQIGGYDKILADIQKQITATTVDRINDEWERLLLKNGNDQNKIQDIRIEINKQTEFAIAKKWRKLIQQFADDPQMIEKISNDLYVNHEKGRDNMEQKATSLLIAVGFTVSLISIIIGFTNADKTSMVSISFVLIFFILSIINMLLAAISAGFAIQVSQKHISNLLDLENTLSGNNFEMEWTIKQLTNIELNNMHWDIKGYWLDSGQKHFIIGLFYAAFGFFAIVADIMYNLYVNWYCIVMGC